MLILTMLVLMKFAVDLCDLSSRCLSKSSLLMSRDARILRLANLDARRRSGVVGRSGTVSADDEQDSKDVVNSYAINASISLLAGGWTYQCLRGRRSQGTEAGQTVG